MCAGGEVRVKQEGGAAWWHSFIEYKEAASKKVKQGSQRVGRAGGSKGAEVAQQEWYTVSKSKFLCSVVTIVLWPYLLTLN